MRMIVPGQAIIIAVLVFSYRAMDGDEMDPRFVKKDAERYAWMVSRVR